MDIEAAIKAASDLTEAHGGKSFTPIVSAAVYEYIKGYEAICKFIRWMGTCT